MQTTENGFTLGIVDAFLRHDDDLCDPPAAHVALAPSVRWPESTSRSSEPNSTCRPVSRSSASSYLLIVPSTTSAGSVGAGGSRSQPEVVSQSRRYCLSKLAWAEPGANAAASQKRELSGVRISSMT